MPAAMGAGSVVMKHADILLGPDGRYCEAGFAITEAAWFQWRVCHGRPLILSVGSWMLAAGSWRQARSQVQCGM